MVISSHAGSNKRGASSTATMERVPISTDISNKHNIGASTSENHSIQSVCFEKKERANEQEQSYRTIRTIITLTESGDTVVVDFVPPVH